MTFVERSPVTPSGNSFDNTFIALAPQTTSAGNIVLTLPSEKVSGLLQTVLHHLGTNSGASAVQLVSAYTGEGSEPIGFEMAYAAAQTGKKVLFIDTSARSRFAVLPVAHRNALSLHHVLRDDPPVVSPFLTFAGTSLYFTTLPENPQGQILFPTKDMAAALLAVLRDHFDLIVLQAEDAMRSQAATTLAGLVDGTVIVIEAERTRFPVARQLRQMIEDNGGKVMGAVLNKRRLYIWKTIYALLFRS